MLTDGGGLGEARRVPRLTRKGSVGYMDLPQANFIRSTRRKISNSLPALVEILYNTNRR